MRELIIRDGQTRLNVPGTSVEVLRDVALRFEITIDSEDRLVLAMLVKDKSPLIFVKEEAHVALQRVLKEGIVVEAKEG